MSFPRKRESTEPSRCWIPAFAGMTRRTGQFEYGLGKIAQPTLLLCMKYGQDMEDREVRLASGTRRDFLKAAGVCASAFVVSGCMPGAKKSVDKTSRDRPNILWITCEDVSPQYLGCYGDDYATTPNLDKFAAQAVRYSNAFATAPVYAPARSCLITGVYATSTGTQHLRCDVKLPRKIRCFPRLLREAGYYCSNN